MALTGTRRSIPQFVTGIHITGPDIDEMVQRGVVKRHVVSPMVQLILVEHHKASMEHEVINGQPLLKDIAEVLLRVLRSKQG